MDKKLIVNVSDHETRVALLEDGTIAELFVERKDESDIAGNIYKGRVQRVLPGMQAAFVDIGLSQAAFIYVDDVIDENSLEFEKMFADDAGDGEDNEDDDLLNGPQPAAHKPAHIQDVLTEGQEIMVQVAKSSIGTKGARVTSHISLPAGFWY